MLVSSIAKISAVSRMHNSAYSMMQISGATTNTVADTNTFGGEHDLSMLNNMDKKFSLDLASNSLLYKIAYLQEKLLNKNSSIENKKNKGFSAIA